MDQKIKNIIIGSLAVLVLGLSCYFIYNKFGSKKENNGNISENEKDIKVTLLEIIKEYGLDALHYEEDDIEFNETPKNSQLYLAALYYSNFNKNNDYVMTREELDDYFDKVYGYKPNSYPNVKCQVEKEDLYIYKDNKYVFNEEHPGHGYYGNGFLDSYIVDYVNNKNEYTISVLFLYGNEMEGYSVNEDELFKNEDDYKYASSEESLINYFKNNIDNYINGIKYRYTFEKVNGKYILKSFKEVK